MRMVGALVLLFALTGPAASAVSRPSVIVHGTPVRSSPPPVVRKGRIYVPVLILRQLGLVVNAGTDRAYVGFPDTEHDDVIMFEPGRVSVTNSGPDEITEETIDRTPFLQNGALMVPLHVLARQWKYHISLKWNARTKTASIAATWLLLIEGKAVVTTPEFVIRHGRVYIPVLTLSQLGLHLDIDPVYRGAKRRMVAVAWPDTDDFINFEAGRAWLVYEGPRIREETIDRTPFILDGALMVPLAVIARHWEGDLTLEWNPKTKTVNIRVGQARKRLVEEDQAPPMLSVPAKPHEVPDAR